VTESEEIQESWKRCTFYTNKALGFATGALFVRGTGQENNIDEVSICALLAFLLKTKL
jgi:hypothetical protein